MVKPSKSSGYSSGGESQGKKKKKKSENENENDLSVYDFGFDDKRIEKEAKKWLSKFKPQSSKFSGSPVDKYCFLRSFTQGARACETSSKYEVLDIEDSNDNVEQMACASDVAETSILTNLKASANSPVANCPSGGSSYFCEGKRPRRRISSDALLKIYDPPILVKNQRLSVDSGDDHGNKNLLPTSLDSDEYCRIGLRSPISAPYLAKNKASPEEKTLDHASCILDVVAVVVVKPDIIIFGDMYSTDATLTFSDKYIKVEGSTVSGMKNSFVFKWSVSDIVQIESSWYKGVETVRVEIYLKSGDEKLAEVSEVGKLNFAICDPCWSERQEAIESLDTIYKATWNTVIDSSKAFEGIIYPQGDPDAVSISMKDFQLLQPATFINDTIVDFYIKYLEQKLKPDEKPRFHFFNSFFFRKLVDEKSPSAAFDGRAAFQRVCKWTRKVNLFEKDYLFIPVNFSLHWSLIVVCHPGEVANYEGKEIEQPLKFPCILHMDSIKRSHRGLKNIFQRYLLEEWRERCNEQSKDVSNKFLNLPFKSLELPQQENSSDCGLFLLYFVERFLEEAPINFNPHAAASRFLNKKWFPPTEASGRRGYIKNVLYRIINDNVQKYPPITNYYDSLKNEMEGIIGKEPLETCNGGDMGSYSTLSVNKNIPRTQREATNIRRLQYSKRLNLVPGDSLDQGDTGWSLTKGNYDFCDQLKSLKQFHGIMSPVEEEETKEKNTAFSSDEASRAFSEQTLMAPSMQYDYASETLAGKFPILLEIQDDGNSTPERLLVSTCEERTGDNEPVSASSKELSSPVDEDSYESGKCGVDDNGDHPIHEAKSFSISDQVVDSAHNAGVKKHNLHPLAWILDTPRARQITESASWHGQHKDSSSRTAGNEPLLVSSEERCSSVIEDSYDSVRCGVNDNENHPFHEAKSLSISDQVVDSPHNTGIRAHNLLPLAWYTPKGSASWQGQYKSRT